MIILKMKSVLRKLGSLVGVLVENGRLRLLLMLPTEIDASVIYYGSLTDDKEN